MATQTENGKHPISSSAFGPDWIRWSILGLGAALVVYLCWRMIAPFVPAIAWAFGLAVIADPVQGWLLKKSLPRNAGALITVVLVLIVLLGPGILLVRALVGEASELVGRLGTSVSTTAVQNALENQRVLGPVLKWLDSQYDLPREALQSARLAASWLSATLSAALTVSLWFLTQVVVAVFVLFYFLRDGQVMLAWLRDLIPLSAGRLDAISSKVIQTIRISLAAKILMASIQGTLGGLMFFWLGLPAPVFWGLVMAFFSVLPILGAFVVWVPAALFFAVQREWLYGLILTGWGVLIINPVDNLLGPVLVGTRLHLHTLLMFFSLAGGVAAFGASGIVLGPLVVAVAAALFQTGRPSRAEP